MLIIGIHIELYFKQAIDRHASDLYLIEGKVPTLRIAGDLVPIGHQTIPYDELRYAIFSLLEKETRDKFLQDKDLDIALEFFNNRFRVNLHFQKGKVGLSARTIPLNIPAPEDIMLEPVIQKLARLRDGFVLITGPSGAGKSTTLAVILELINRHRRAHVITIEDPIEFVFTDKKSIIEQRQLGQDINDFQSGLKYALRQDPDVIMVGEMRDHDTIDAALLAARTGHLVLSTLHTSTSAETVKRVLDFFPAHDQPQVSRQLSSVLRAVVAQQLAPRTGGGLVAAREILLNNRAAANLIKDNRLDQLATVIQTNLQIGMIPMNKSIERLCAQGYISRETAENYLRDLETEMAGV